MTELLIILLLIGGAVYYLNYTGSGKVYAEPKFQLRQRIVVNERPAYIFAIYKGSNEVDYIYKYKIVYTDFWRREENLIDEANIKDMEGVELI